MFDERADRRRRGSCPIRVERRDAPRCSPARASLDEAVRVGARPRALAPPARPPRPEATASRCPRPSQLPWHGGPSRHDDDVPELGPAAVEAPVEHEPAADAGAEREHRPGRRSPPRAEPPLGERRRVAVVLDAGRQPEPLAQRGREKSTSWSGRLFARSAIPVRAVDRHRDADADRGRTVGEQTARRRRRAPARNVLGRRRWASGPRSSRPIEPSRPTRPAQDLRPADVDPDDPVWRHGAATIPGPHARSGQALPGVSGRPGQGQRPAHATRREGPRGRRPSGATPQRPAQAAAAGVAGSSLALVLLLVLARRVGLSASYLSFSSGIEEANDRVPAGVRRQLTKTDGMLALDADDDPRPRHRRRQPAPGARAPTAPTRSCCSAPTRASTGWRSSRSRATSGSRSRTSGRRRSTPRTRSAARRSPLRTVKELTGLDVNHVAFVDFDRFEELIDAVGGIEVNVPAADPLQQVRLPVQDRGALQRMGGLALRARGTQHMDGRRALVYSRIRREPPRTRARPTSTARAASSR